MTREDAILHMTLRREELKLSVGDLDEDIKAFDMAIRALEQKSKAEQFAEWVAEEIFSELWEYNKEAFEELACRKLAKLGIVRANGDEWELIEPQESEVKECEEE